MLFSTVSWKRNQKFFPMGPFYLPYCTLEYHPSPPQKKKKTPPPLSCQASPLNWQTIQVPRFSAIPPLREFFVNPP